MWIALRGPLKRSELFSSAERAPCAACASSSAVVVGGADPGFFRRADGVKIGSHTGSVSSWTHRSPKASRTPVGRRAPSTPRGRAQLSGRRRGTTTETGPGDLGRLARAASAGTLASTCSPLRGRGCCARGRCRRRVAELPPRVVGILVDHGPFVMLYGEVTKGSWTGFAFRKAPRFGRVSRSLESRVSSTGTESVRRTGSTWRPTRQERRRTLAGTRAAGARRTSSTRRSCCCWRGRDLEATRRSTRVGLAKWDPSIARPRIEDRSRHPKRRTPSRKLALAETTIGDVGWRPLALHVAAAVRNHGMGPPSQFRP